MVVPKERCDCHLGCLKSTGNLNEDRHQCAIARLANGVATVKKEDLFMQTMRDVGVIR